MPGIRNTPGTSIIVLGMGLALSACSSARGGIDGEWVGERVVDGNVTTVTTLRGSVWGGRARLIEEASIGSSDGDDAYLLGRVSSGNRGASPSILPTAPYS